MLTSDTIHAFFSASLAIIENIRDGSTVRACLTLPNGEYQYITLMISGIRAPMIRQGIANTEDVVEPFAEEVKRR